MASTYVIGGKRRVHLDNAEQMRSKVIAIQAQLADLPKEYQEHPDVAEAVDKAFQLRAALEKLL